MAYKTCKDLESSLYLGPDQFRACCQRFFYEGKMRGDAPLINLNKNSSPTALTFTGGMVYNQSAGRSNHLKYLYW